MTHRTERDEWVLSGPRIDDAEKRRIVQDEFDKQGEDALIIVMREYLNGATGPTLTACKTMAEFDAFLETVEPGDIVDVWAAWSVCTRDKMLTWGKKPDEEGYVPLKGAY